MDAEGILARKSAEAEGQRKMVDARTGEGVGFIVVKALRESVQEQSVVRCPF